MWKRGRIPIGQNHTANSRQSDVVRETSQNAEISLRVWDQLKMCTVRQHGQTKDWAITKNDGMLLSANKQRNTYKKITIKVGQYLIN